MSDAAEQLLASGRLALRTVTPYYRHKVLAMRPMPVKGLKAMTGGAIGLTEHLVLPYDPDEIVKMTVGQVVVSLVHEVGHHNNKHWIRGRNANVGEDWERWITAGDAELNDDLEEAIAAWNAKRGSKVYSWPYEVVLPSSFGMPNNLLAEQYYAGKQGKGGKPQPKPGMPCNCGSAAGGKAPLEVQVLDKLHGQSKQEMKRLDRVTAKAIQDHAKSHGVGSVPAGWRTWADEQLGPPEVDWRPILRRAVRQAVQHRMGYVDTRYTRPSRRQAGMGWGHGCGILPGFVAPLPNVSIYLDTSGSMGKEEYALVMPEVAGVLNELRVPTRFTSLDCEIQLQGTIKDWRAAAALIQGGGGTSFVPAFEDAAKCKPRPDIIIILTDGCGPAPEDPPRGQTVVWVLCGGYARAPVKWGTSLYVGEAAKKAHAQAGDDDE